MTKNELDLILPAMIGSSLSTVANIELRKGITYVSSNLATAIRTIIILMVAWGIVLARGEIKDIVTLLKQNLIFLVISGIATGLSWIFYFKALNWAKSRKWHPLIN